MHLYLLSFHLSGDVDFSSPLIRHSGTIRAAGGEINSTPANRLSQFAIFDDPQERQQ